MISPFAAQLSMLDGTADGEERLALSALRRIYIQVAEVIQSAIKEANSMQFAWASRLEALEEQHTEADKMYIHMKADLKNEESRYKDARDEADRLRGSLPPDGGEMVGIPSRFIAYRKQKWRSREDDADKLAKRLESLKHQVHQQEDQVERLNQAILPVLSVHKHLEKATETFHDIVNDVHLESERILKRMGSAIATLDTGLWGHIFTFVIGSINEENVEMVRQHQWNEITSPIKATLSLAHVSRRWREIIFSSEMKHLWSHWAIDVGHPAFKHPTLRQFPSLAEIPSAQLLLYSGNLNLEFLPSGVLLGLQVYLRGIRLSHLTLAYGSLHEKELTKLFSTSQDSLLTSVHLIGESRPPMKRATVPPAVAGGVQELYLSDTCIETPQGFRSLRILHILISYQPFYTDMVSAEQLRELICGSPLLTDIEVDLGFDDTPRFALPLPSILCMPNLRHLGLRLSYFRNRLSFLQSTTLPCLDSIKIFAMPSSERGDIWHHVESFFSRDSRGLQIVTLKSVDFERCPGIMADTLGAIQKLLGIDLGAPSTGQVIS
ncbi:hypothetical protein FRC17_002310 [Serendipita sp. 399]|nr:hypothetical protein FRC17_002310 [Serendipita sp. 399]